MRSECHLAASTLKLILKRFPECTVSAAGDRGLRYVLYEDAVVPGNPFRPDKARKVEAFYWIFVDFPDFVLQRSACWPVLTLIRSKIIAQIPGGVSHVTRFLLNMFRPFSDGVVLPSTTTPCILRARFGGFLADLLGHKELMCSKGVSSAIHPCWNCANLAMRPNGNYRDGELTIACWDIDSFMKHTDESLFDMVDRLHDSVGRVSNGRVLELQTATGFNVCEAGLLRDKTLRDIYSPTNHHLRDWMHTVVGDGIANTETGLVLHAMRAHKISLAMVQDFLVGCKLPQMHGKVQRDWLKESRLKGNTMSSFAGIMLTVVPIVALFLDYFNVKEYCPAEVQSYELLHALTSLLRLSPSKVPAHISKMKGLIRSHQEAFVIAYGSEMLKPKAHQMHHVVDHIEYLGKCLSCFVTERKHREVKKSAINVFRHVESTTLRDMLNSQYQYMSSGHDLFTPQFLSNTRLQDVKVGGRTFRLSKGSAVCHVGELFAGDIVFMKTGIVMQIAAFWQEDDSDICIEGSALHAVADDVSVRSLTDVTTMFQRTVDICDACIYFSPSPGVVKISIPPHALILPTG